MNGQLRSQRGVGIVEVMIALVVLMFSALSISNLQTRSLVSMQISESHFTINERSREMLEVLRANAVDARSGVYNLEFDDTLTVPDPVESPVEYTVYQWKQSISEELRNGAGRIGCDAVKCTVSLRWIEYIDGLPAQQFFHIAGPI